MAELTDDQLADLRADIGDDGTVFTADELHRLFTRADSDYELTVVLALRQMLAQASKLHDYRLAQSAENLSQVRKHIKDLLEYWEEKVQRVKQQISIVAMRRVPPTDRDLPT